MLERHPAGGRGQPLFLRNEDRNVTQPEGWRHRIAVEVSDGEVYRKVAGDLIRFATGLVGPNDASDVVSEAVVSCLSSERWPDVDNKRAYLYRSVLNKAAQFHRSAHRRSSRERLSARPERIEMPDVRPEILAAVFRLSIRQRAVVFLTYWEDLDPKAIADLLSISNGSVRRHLARGKTHLKETLHADD